MDSVEFELLLLPLLLGIGYGYLVGTILYQLLRK